MRSRLEAKLSWLGDFRTEAIDGILAELADPTPFMLEAGSLAFNLSDIAPEKMRLKQCWQAMLSEAAKGG